MKSGTHCPALILGVMRLSERRAAARKSQCLIVHRSESLLDIRLKRADFRSERAEFKLGRADLRSGRVDLRPERGAFKPEKSYRN